VGGVPRLLLLEQSGLCSSKKCRWFQVTDCWTNPRATRAAIQEVRNAHAVNCLSAPPEDFYDHDDDFKSENGLDDLTARQTLSFTAGKDSATISRGMG
jgi:hypothetical protein